MDKEKLNEIAELLGEPGPNEELFFARRRALGLGVGLDENGEMVSVGGPVFINFVTSPLSPDSWPNEVGLAWLDGVQVIAESRFIQPRSECNWNAETQDMGGSQRSKLDDTSSPDDVAKWLLETVGGRPFFSNTAESDQRCLKRLLCQIGPQISDFDGAVWAAFSSEGCMAPGHLHRVYSNMEDWPTLPPTGANAANLAHAWRAGIGR